MCKRPPYTCSGYSKETQLRFKFPVDENCIMKKEKEKEENI